MSLAENIVRLQKERGESNYRLAKCVGVTITSVQNWRTGKTRPMNVYLEKLAEHFGCSVEDLIKENTT